MKKVIKTFRQDQKEEALKFKEFFKKTVGIEAKSIFGKDPNGIYPGKVYTIYLDTEKGYEMYEKAHRAGRI